MLRGRLIKVLPKRTNLPFFALPQQRGSGPGYRGSHHGGYHYPPQPYNYHHPSPYYYAQRGGRGGYTPNRGAPRYPRGGSGYRGASSRRGSGAYHHSSSTPASSGDEHGGHGTHSSPSSSTFN